MKISQLLTLQKKLGDGTMTIADLQDKLTLKTPVKTVPSSKGSTVIDGLAAGYYLVKDKDGTQKDTQDAYTKYIVQVVGDTTAAIKSGVPTVEKKVKDINDSKGETSDWQDSADADFNDNVKYKITGTMPSNIGSYKSYQYIFTDTMSKGLTYKASDNNVKNYEIYFYANKDDAAKDAKAKGVNITESFKDNGEGDSVTNSSDAKYNGGKKFTWTCSDLKSINSLKDQKGNSKLTENSAIVVYYEAKLKEGAVIGAAGNPNKVDLTYSNNPNKSGEGETGKTPDDTNIVFTYKTVVNKVDQDGKTPLKGAGFTLQKKVNGAYTDVKVFTASNATTFEFTGLDDGKYKLIESTTPAGYNTITPIEFTISATHNETSDDPQLLTLSGNKTAGEATFTADKGAGSLTTNVVNKPGSILPETGGMGTTLLYVLGGVLVALAAAYVIYTKKHEKA